LYFELGSEKREKTNGEGVRDEIKGVQKALKRLLDKMANVKKRGRNRTTLISGESLFSLHSLKQKLPIWQSDFALKRCPNLCETLGIVMKRMRAVKRVREVMWAQGSLYKSGSPILVGKVTAYTG
jgi:hypothetical protein